MKGAQYLLLASLGFMFFLLEVNLSSAACVFLLFTIVVEADVEMEYRCITL